MTKKIYQGDGWSFNPGPKAPKEPPSKMRRENIKIRLEKRKNNKIVTVIQNLPFHSLEMKELSSQMKSYCGTGGTVKDSMIELQGDFVQKVQVWLAEKGFLQKK